MSVQLPAPGRCRPFSPGSGRLPASWALGLALLTILAIAAPAPPARAHGVEGRIIPCRTVTLLATYSDGEPMSYSDAVVLSPSGGDLPFLRGRTDRLGRVAFCPDQPGAWRVEVSDGMGHKLVQTVDVAPEASPGQGATPQGAEATTPPPSGLAALPYYMKLLVGLCIVFGLAGMAALLWRRGGKGPGS